MTVDNLYGAIHIASNPMIHWSLYKDWVGAAMVYLPRKHEVRGLSPDKGHWWC